MRRGSRHVCLLILSEVSQSQHTSMEKDYA